MPQKRVGAYAKLLANYASDDAIIAAGEKAELLFCRGLAFLATADSDGYITEAQLVRFVGAGMSDAKKRAQALVREGLWEAVDGGYIVRSWLKIHDSAEEKGRKRRTDRERKQRGKPENGPDGIPPDSARIPDGTTPESLLCGYVSSSVSTEHCNPEQGSAATAHDAAPLGDAEPSPFCSKHPNGTEKSCGPCGTAKLRWTRWAKSQPAREAAAKRDAQSLRQNCPDCHGDVWLEDGTKCTHANARVAS